jgi:hypothetical protein
MRRSTLTAVALATSATVVLAAEPAHAATWNIARPANCTTNPCNITVKDTGVQIFKDVRTNTVIDCTNATMQGFLLVGNNVGNPLGDILGPAATPFVGCTGAGFAFGTTGTFNWFLNGTSYAAGVTTGQMWKIHVEFTSPMRQCVFDIDGAASFTYTNATGALRFDPTVGLMDQLTIDNVAGCGAALANGDQATFSGSDTVTWNSDGTHPQITAS